MKALRWMLWPISLSLALAADRVVPRSPFALRADSLLAASAGPLRPLLSELMILRLFQRAPEDLLGRLEQSRAVLRLRPDLPNLWTQIAFQLALDVPLADHDAERAAAWVREGLAVLEEALQRMPEVASLHLSYGQLLDVLIRTHPERLTTLGRRVEDSQRLAWETYLRGWKLSAAGSEDARAAAYFGSMLTEQLLEDSAVAVDRRRLNEAIQAWLQSDDLGPARRKVLQELGR